MTDYPTVRLDVDDGHPKLVIEELDIEILLRTHVTVSDDSNPLGDREITTRVDTDCDADNGCWWEVLNDGIESDRHPWVSIQPEVLEGDD